MLALGDSEGSAVQHQHQKSISEYRFILIAINYECSIHVFNPCDEVPL